MFRLKLRIVHRHKDYLLKVASCFITSSEEEDAREEGALRLASLGWSLPIQLTQKQIVEVAKAKYKEEEIDETILNFFTNNNYAVLNELVLHHVLTANDFTLWKETVKEC